MNVVLPGAVARKAYVVGTLDTKGEELRYVRDLIAQAGIAAVLVDVGPRSREADCDIRSALRAPGYEPVE